MDFTIDLYRQLCETLLHDGFVPLTVDEYMRAGSPEGRSAAIIRHDVDRRPNRALRIAKVENALGIRSTFYFRMIPQVYVVETVHEIRELGHEIGYHYETLSKCRGSLDEAIALFGAELDQLRRTGEVTTATMHGSPLSRFDNRDIWRRAKPEQFGLIGEPYLSIDFSVVRYLTDTGGSWSSGIANVRDRVDGVQGFDGVSTTHQLLRALAGYEGHVMVQTHPERWTDGLGEHFHMMCWDGAANTAKGVLRAFRSLR